MRLTRLVWGAALAAGFAAGLLPACTTSAPIRGAQSAGAGGNAGATGSAGNVVTSGGGGANTRATREISWAIDRDVDLLFMVDNSSSMQPLQARLLASFPAFATALASLPGGLPNLHLAVVSSDLGAGQFSEAAVPGCRPGGDQGKFQFMPRGTCTGAGLDAGDTFIKSQNGVANFTGDLSATFSCIAALGQNGCGFEHQFGSVLRALGADGAPAPTENAGFLRPGALLAVVLLTNEDDCSAPPDAALFDPASTLTTDMYGPLLSYRCNEFGHLCAGKKPPRTVAMDTPLTDCHSAEDGVLLRVADVKTRLRQLKADPGRVLVAAIAAPATPYVVTSEPKLNPDEPSPTVAEIAHSCTDPQSGYGDPAVRIDELVKGFGANGTFDVICNTTFTPTFTHIINAIGADFSPNPCLEAKPVDTDLAKVGLQSDCTFVDHAPGAGGTQVSTPLPSCDKTSGAAPCWSLATDARCGAGELITITRAAGAAMPTSTTVSCTLCAANDARPGCAS